MKLDPVLHDGKWCFCAAGQDALIPVEAIAMFRESEGTTFILSAQDAEKLGLSAIFYARWIEISADTSLDETGITAAISAKLADAGISCNVWAANNHDHIFVPFPLGRKAWELLKEL
ncbi:MAG: ACT domain-containing protein [Rickettsiales bacterium]|jgi:hypothetical protein|nr:ACT domain-containing protein [Rickettsiales bacterium]